jgi:hypothetical protein
MEGFEMKLNTLLIIGACFILTLSCVHRNTGTGERKTDAEIYDGVSRGIRAWCYNEVSPDPFFSDKIECRPGRYCVTSKKWPFHEVSPVKLPDKVIKYALIEFVKIPANYEYMDSVVENVKIGMEQEGSVQVKCLSNHKGYEGTLRYIKSKKELEVLEHHLNNTIDIAISTIDLSELDL